MPHAAIAITGLQKRFGQQQVLSDVSLSVRAGEYVGLVGVNGVGKTTLIKCILDFCVIDAGSIKLFGVDHRQTAARQSLAYLPERFTPPYYLTGADFLKYMAELNGVMYHEADALDMLKLLDLDGAALKKPVRQFSKGMGQKLGLAACFMSNKELMIFDEPTSGLDPKARALLKRHLLHLKEQGRTLFYSTHLLEDIQALCDRVIILHAGKVRFAGTVQECCAAYNANDLENAYLACTEAEV